MIPVPPTIRSKHPVHALPCPRAVEPAASATDTATPPAAARARHRRSPVLRQSFRWIGLFTTLPRDFHHGSRDVKWSRSNHPTQPHQQRNYIYHIGYVAAGSSNKISSRIEAHDVVPSIRYECLTNVCTTAAAHFLSWYWYEKSRGKILTKCPDFDPVFLNQNAIQSEEIPSNTTSSQNQLTSQTIKFGRTWLYFAARVTFLSQLISSADLAFLTVQHACGLWSILLLKYNFCRSETRQCMCLVRA